MEYAASRLSSQFNSLQLLQEMATQGSLGKIKPSVALTSTIV